MQVCDKKDFMVVTLRKRKFIMITLFSACTTLIFLLFSGVVISLYSFTPVWVFAVLLPLSLAVLSINKVIRSQSNLILVSDIDKEFIYIIDGLRSKKILKEKVLDVKIFGKEKSSDKGRRENNIRNMQRFFLNLDYMCTVNIFHEHKVIFKITGLTDDQAMQLKVTLENH